MKTLSPHIKFNTVTPTAYQLQALAYQTALTITRIEAHRQHGRALNHTSISFQGNSNHQSEGGNN